MSKKRLSIIIPLYNVEQYIAQCLDSVYNQDIPEDEYEVICVDDCSPDHSISIVEEYARKHTNLVIVRNQYNRKLGGARNAGMEVAKGDYVWFIDSDDFIKTFCIGKLLTIAETDKLDVLHFQYENFPDTWTPPRNPVDGTIMTGTEMFFSQDYIWYHDLVTAWRKIYKRQFLLENNIAFAEHIMFEDNDYAIEVFANAKRVKHIADIVYYYRYNPESITRVKYTSVHISYWLNLCHRLRALKDEFIQKKYDVRFVELIDGFIRNNINNILNMYDQVDTIYRKEARRMICKEINSSLKPYISKQKYYKIKLGML